MCSAYRLLLALALTLAPLLRGVAACTSLLAGPGATADGSVLLARSDDGSDAISDTNNLARGRALAALACSCRVGSGWMPALALRLARTDDDAPPRPASRAGRCCTRRAATPPPGAPT